MFDIFVALNKDKMSGSLMFLNYFQIFFPQRLKIKFVLNINIRIIDNIIYLKVFYIDKVIEI